MPNSHFYVACHDGDRWSLLAGPYGSESEAAGMVEAVVEIACRIDRKAPWYRYEVCQTDSHSKPGLFNLQGRL